MKKILVVLMLGLVSIIPLSADEYDNYQEWEEHEIVRIYEEVSHDYAQKYGYYVKYEDARTSSTRYFDKVSIEEGAYKIELYDNVFSRFWGIRFTKYFIEFRYNPYLYNFDEGVLEWDGDSGTFYEKP